MTSEEVSQSTEEVAQVETTEDAPVARPKRSVTIAEPAENGTDAKPKKSAPKKAAAKPKAKKTTKKKSGSLNLKDAVIAAIGALDDGKGASYPGIKAFILENNDNVREDMIKYQVRVGLTKAFENELIRSHKPLEDGKVTLSARWHLRSKAKKEANSQEAKKKTATKATTKKKSGASKKAAPKSSRSKLTKVKRNDGGKYTLQDIVLSAIGAIDDTKGASYPAIKAWIEDNIKTVRVEMLKHQIRVGLTKALGNDLIYPKKPLADGNVSLSARWYLKGEARKVMAKK